MGLHGPAHQGEAQAGAARPAGEKWLKEPGGDVLAHAPASVTHRKNHLSGRHPDCQPQATPFLHRLDGVEDEVENSLLEQRTIPPDPGNPLPGQPENRMDSGCGHFGAG